MASVGNRVPSRSERLLQALAPYERVAIVMHDNPDPDAIATGWAIKYLIEAKLGKPTRLIGGGAIVRAENRHLVELLNPPLELVDDFQPDERTGVVLVDCGPGAANHLMSGEVIAPVAVIDHHQTSTPNGTAFVDVRPKVAASATIAATYLYEQKLEPGRDLATALAYALHTETQGGETHFSMADRVILRWLGRWADPRLLAEIDNAPLPRAYFGDLVLALQNTFIYEDAAFCLLPRAQGPEIVGEVADLLIRCEGVHRVLCAAVCGKQVLLSVRTDAEGGDATALLLDTIRGVGRGGGHRHRAGGKLTATTAGSRVPEDLQDKLRERWLKACGLRRRRGSRLVSRREMAINLRFPTRAVRRSNRMASNSRKPYQPFKTV